MVQPNVTLFTFWEVAGGRLSFGRCGVGIVGGRQWVGGLNLPSNRKRLACNPVCTSTAAFISDQFRKIICIVCVKLVYIYSDQSKELICKRPFLLNCLTYNLQLDSMCVPASTHHFGARVHNSATLPNHLVFITAIKPKIGTQINVFFFGHFSKNIFV